jgi:hypothetical protein
MAGNQLSGWPSAKATAFLSRGMHQGTGASVATGLHRAGLGPFDVEQTSWRSFRTERTRQYLSSSRGCDAGLAMAHSDELWG